MTSPRLLTREMARAIDRDAQARLLLPGDLLMENAGAHVARHALALAHEHGLARAIVLCGPGNNGGDGLVAARHLLSHIQVDAWLLGDETQLQGDAQRNLCRFHAQGGALRTIDTRGDVDQALAAQPPALVIDALYGIGLNRPLEGLPRAVIESVLQSKAKVLAVDVPSGLDCDTGKILGAAVRATITVTFVKAKVGFAIGRGPESCGRVVVESIGFAPPR